MKYLVLPFLFAVSAYFAHAQNNDWFKGDWYGIKSFTGARIGIRVLVRIEVDSIYANRFSGRLIYMYPKDTIGRLVRTFDGNIKGRDISLNKSKEIYLLDPRSRSFWSNCSACNETTSLSLSDSSLVFKINIANCGDSCNGETVFSRDLYSYDSSMQAKIKNLFIQKQSVAKTNSKQKNKNTQPAKKSLADKNQVKPVVTAKINPNQKDKSINTAKKNLPDTIKNNRPLEKRDSAQAIKITDRASKTDTLTHTTKIAGPDSLLQAMLMRQTDLIQTYQVDSPHIRVDLFDNGQIDSDIVSVYYNGNLIINHVTLSDTALTFTIDASATSRYHEFILIAENEGSIPPNTALMRIKAGSQQYKLTVSTSGTKNAKIAIDYLGD